MDEPIPIPTRSRFGNVVNREQVPEEMRTELQGNIAAVRSALEAGEPTALKSAVDELQEAMQKVGQHVYSQAAAGGGGGPSAGPEAPEDGPLPGGEDTVEGEFREV